MFPYETFNMRQEVDEVWEQVWLWRPYSLFTFYISLYISRYIKITATMFLLTSYKLILYKYIYSGQAALWRTTCICPSSSSWSVWTWKNLTICTYPSSCTWRYVGAELVWDSPLHSTIPREKTRRCHSRNGATGDEFSLSRLWTCIFEI